MDESSSGNEEDIDIYDDLPVVNFEDEVQKLEEDRDGLKETLVKAQERLKILSARNDFLEKENKALQENISSLYKTASGELQRKDRMITELRREKDSILFRRQRKERLDTVETHRPTIESPVYEQESCISPCPDENSWPEQLIPVTVKAPPKDSEKFANILLMHYKCTEQTQSPEYSNEEYEQKSDILELCINDAENLSLKEDDSEQRILIQENVPCDELSSGKYREGKNSLVRDGASDYQTHRGQSRSTKEQRTLSLERKRDGQIARQGLGNKHRNRSWSAERKREHIIGQRENRERERSLSLERRKEYMRQDSRRYSRDLLRRNHSRSREPRTRVQSSRHRRENEHFSNRYQQRGDVESERHLKSPDLKRARRYNEKVYCSPTLKRREGHSRSISEAFRVKSKYSRATRERSVSAQCFPKSKVCEQTKAKSPVNYTEKVLHAQSAKEEHIRRMEDEDLKNIDPKDKSQHSQKTNELMKIPLMDGNFNSAYQLQLPKESDSVSSAARRDAIDLIRKFRIPKRRVSDVKSDVAEQKSVKSDVSEQKKANELIKSGQGQLSVITVVDSEVRKGEKNSDSEVERALDSDGSHLHKPNKSRRLSHESDKTNLTVLENCKSSTDPLQDAIKKTNLLVVDDKGVNREANMINKVEKSGTEKSNGDDTPKTKRLSVSSLRSSPGESATVRDGKVSVSFSSEQCEFTTRRRRRSLRQENNVGVLVSSRDTCTVSNPEIMQEAINSQIGSSSRDTWTVSNPEIRQEAINSQIGSLSRGVKRFADSEESSSLMETGQNPEKKVRKSCENEKVSNLSSSAENKKKRKSSYKNGNAGGKGDVRKSQTPQNKNEEANENDAVEVAISKTDKNTEKTDKNKETVIEMPVCTSAAELLQKNEKLDCPNNQEKVAKHISDSMKSTDLCSRQTPLPEHPSPQSANITLPGNGPVLVRRRVRKPISLSCNETYTLNSITNKSEDNK